jgi:hypothetical protein
MHKKIHASNGTKAEKASMLSYALDDDDEEE